ncbi:hypothetical protein [uncultured Veillonella sp.]|uniref:rolling circle replication-associated protein n=1 Tax=uncultured Veillonella sp. TaxID=159268 RepID=UPI0025972AEE|nr:hypothetical protein [uncultured Veillonella sp.]
MRKRKIIKSKNMTEIYDSLFIRSYQGHGKKPRLPRRKPTAEEVKKNNLRMAKAKLRMLIDNNFREDDYYLTLTFKKELAPDESKKAIQKFVRDLRKRYRRVGKELKYIYIAEEKGRLHFHMLVNREIELTTSLMRKLWPYGFTEIKYYRGAAEDAIAMAEYFTKERNIENDNSERIFKRTWVKSNNVHPPEEKVKVMKATEWRREVNVPQGYYMDKDSYIEGVNNAGYPFRFYRLIKIRGPMIE